MMRRETAYKLAGRKHQRESELSHELRFQEIRFFSEPADQASRALEFLQKMPGLGVTLSRNANGVKIRYDLGHYTLRAIETPLEELGFRLDDSFLVKLRRALVYFCEDTRCRSASLPQRLIKKSNEVYVEAYQHHPHGDHDDTPPELRVIK